MNQHRRRRPRTAGSDAVTGMLFWLTVLGLGGVALACIVLGVVQVGEPQIAEIQWQADPAIPKIGTTIIESPDSLAEPAAAAPEPHVSAPRDTSTAEPRFQTELHPQGEKLFMPLAVDAAPVLQRETQAPVAAPKLEPAPTTTTIPTPHRDLPTGDTPMMRTWKMLALTSLLLASAPTYAPAGGGEPDPKALKKSVDDLRKTVESMSAKLDKAAAAMSSKDVLAETGRLEKTLSAQIDKLKKDLRIDISAIREQQLKQKLDLQALKDLPKKVEMLEADVIAVNEELQKLRKQKSVPVPTAPSIDKAVLDAFHGRLSRIEKLLEGMQAPSISGVDRKISLSPPTAPVAGKVRLINQYVERMMFVVNGSDYFVEPGQMLELRNFPAGSVTYEVVSPIWGVQAQRTTTLQPTETLSVTAR